MHLDLVKIHFVFFGHLGHRYWDIDIAWYGYHQREKPVSRPFTEVKTLDRVDIWMGDHLDKIPCSVLLGKSGWRSGHQSRLPPLQQM